MPQTVVITLTTAGADTGPFNLFSDADGFTAPFQTGVAKASLVAGYTSTVVPDGATVVRVRSTSVLCTNYVDLPIAGITTSTTSTTTSQDLVQIILYARHEPGASVFPLLKFAYSQDGGISWTATGASFDDTSCTQRAILNVQRNSSLAVKITTDGNTGITWQSARDLTGCPAFSAPGCVWFLITNVNTRTFYFTVNGDDQGVC
jgi:hypothetical protein